MDKKAENNQTDKEKVLNIIKNVVTWLVVAAAVAMMIFTIISATTLDRNNRSLFGKKNVHRKFRLHEGDGLRRR